MDQEPAIDTVVQLRDAALAYGPRTLWSGLSLDVRPGEFFTVLGANGSGKTSLLRTMLGLSPLSAGTLSILGRPARRGSRHVGYIQQQRRIDPLTPMRAKDIVRQGIDGHRWGIARPGRAPWGRVDRALAEVDAAHLADTPIGVMSGGEQQRVRIAQALASDPAVILCDEPLLSLDIASQATITALLDRYRRRHDSAIVFVTHEINPVLPYTDRVLYLAGGRFRIGGVDDVMTSATLTELYGTPIDVVRSAGRILVAGIPDTSADTEHHHAAHPVGAA